METAFCFRIYTLCRLWLRSRNRCLLLSIHKTVATSFNELLGDYQILHNYPQKVLICILKLFLIFLKMGKFLTYCNNSFHEIVINWAWWWLHFWVKISWHGDHLAKRRQIMCLWFRFLLFFLTLVSTLLPRLTL